MMQQDTGEYDELGDLDGFVFEDGGASADAGGSNPFAAEVEERARAATTLQAAQRGRRERKAVRDRHDAAVRIQAAHRGRASRRGSAKKGQLAAVGIRGSMMKPSLLNEKWQPHEYKQFIVAGKGGD
eukprot:g4434.t1